MDETGPMLHELQANPFACRRSGREADSVILNEERDGLIVLEQSERDVGRFAVLEGIRDGFLGNMEQVCRGLVVIHFHRIRAAVQSALHAQSSR